MSTDQIPAASCPGPRPVPTNRRPAALNPVRVASEMLLRGLHVDSAVVRGLRRGGMTRWRLGRRVFFGLSEPDHIDHVLFGGTANYHKSLEYELLRSLLGLNLFTDEDDSWKKHRQLLNPILGRRHLRGLYELMLDPVESFTRTLPDEQDRRDIDMVAVMTELTLEVVGGALFGRGLGELARKLKPLVTDGLRAGEVGARLLFVFGPPLWLVRAAAWAVPNLPIPGLRKPREVMRIIDGMVWKVVHERRQDPGEATDLLGLLLNVRDEHDKPLPLRRVRDEAVTFMLAGHETTANALAWMWYLLALNPDARDRMLAEVDTVLGGRPPTVDDIDKLVWTTACFKEAMRFYPPAWVIPREAVADDVIDGYRIPAGATLIIPVHAVHHDPRWWPDPEVFDPARFLPENSTGRHRSAYLPFGAGRRVCIGATFALMEATLITAMMSRHHVYDLVPGHPVVPEATLTLRPQHGLKMVARRRTAPVLAGSGS